MAMIDCKECHEKVSTKAAICPHCGAKVGLSDDDKIYGFAGLFLIMLIVGFWLFL